VGRPCSAQHAESASVHNNIVTILRAEQDLQSSIMARPNVSAPKRPSFLEKIDYNNTLTDVFANNTILCSEWTINQGTLFQIEPIYKANFWSNEMSSPKSKWNFQRYILQQKYLKKWIGSATFNPHTTLSATMHTVRDRQTDGQTWLVVIMLKLVTRTPQFFLWPRSCYVTIALNLFLSLTFLFLLLMMMTIVLMIWAM